MLSVLSSDALRLKTGPNSAQCDGRKTKSNGHYSSSSKTKQLQRSKRKRKRIRENKEREFETRWGGVQRRVSMAAYGVKYRQGEGACRDAAAHEAKARRKTRQGKPERKMEVGMGTRSRGTLGAQLWEGAVGAFLVGVKLTLALLGGTVGAGGAALLLVLRVEEGVPLTLPLPLLLLLPLLRAAAALPELETGGIRLVTRGRVEGLVGEEGLEED